MTPLLPCLCALHPCAGAAARQRPQGGRCGALRIYRRPLRYRGGPLPTRFSGIARGRPRLCRWL